MSYRGSDDEEIIPLWKSRLADPLSGPCRDKRRLLLLSSTVTLIIVLLGLFPTKIDALGITFETADRAKMILIAAAVTAYALSGFFLYAWTDLHLLRRKQQASTTGYINAFVAGRSTPLEAISYYLRFAFEFIGPTVYGVYALYQLYVVHASGKF